MYHKPKYYTAIFFDATGKAWKYHNVKNTLEKMRKFEDFARSRGGVKLNYYDSKTGQFVRPQINLLKKSQVKNKS